MTDQQIRDIERRATERARDACARMFDLQATEYADEAERLRKAGLHNDAAHYDYKYDSMKHHAGKLRALTPDQLLEDTNGGEL